jgi:hypothetical protein
MTNVAIIEKESIRLVEQGVLQMMNIGEMEMPEPIHTFQAWKSLGYVVKKGEKAIAKFPIWKYTSKKVETDNGEEETSNMFMKTAAFFKFSQVEKIEAKGV